MPSQKPSLRVERLLQRSGHHLLAGMDEVGRGALAGPVSVGVVVIDPSCRSAPTGVKDSKLLTPSARVRLVPRIRRWALAFAIGHASPEEIDRIGIIAALRLAGTRALAALPVNPDLVILDGNHDWLTEPSRAGLFAFAEPDAAPAGGPGGSGAPAPRLSSGLVAPSPSAAPPVRTMIKADLKCSSVAAASVLAKVERDAMMVELAQTVPTYGWALNKGYSCPEHFAALRTHGPSEHHRRSWRLPVHGEQRPPRQSEHDLTPSTSDDADAAHGAFPEPERTLDEL